MDPLGILCWVMGGLGAFAFAINLLPQLINAVRTKKTGLTYGFFVLALVGNIGSCMLVAYTNWQTGVWQWPLYGNYFTATTLTLILLVLRIRYGK